MSVGKVRGDSCSFWDAFQTSVIYICAPGTLNTDSQDGVYNQSMLSLSQTKPDFLFFLAHLSVGGVSWKVMESRLNESESEVLQEGQHRLWFSIYSSARYDQLTADNQY